MRRVLVACDKFAGTLTAQQACEAIAKGWLHGDRSATVVTCPVADGGPGLLDAVLGLRAMLECTATVRGPLGELVGARFLLEYGPEPTAWLEAAQACGLHLLSPGARDPWRATSAGVADLLLAAVAAGAHRILLGLGGSATVDGGAGLLNALAATPNSGRCSAHALADVELVALVDTDAPLLGPWGAVSLFGRQKLPPQLSAAHADEQLAELELRMEQWVAQGGSRYAETPGAGAAGGLGYAVLQLGGHLESGAARVLNEVGFIDLVSGADLVITGEGRFDHTSLRGKVVSAVAAAAAAAGTPCVVLAGEVTAGRREASAAGIDEAWSVVQQCGSRDVALAEPAKHLADLAAHVARIWA